MKISIITVVFNSQETIAKAIDSVLSQSYDNIEYIIVDGGSKDGTLDIIKSYGAKISKLISEPDKGIYDAMNKGIRLATGEVVGTLNSDDFLADNDVVSRIASFFSSDGNLQAVYSDVLFVQRDDVSKPIRYYSSSKFSPFMFRFGIQPAHPTFYVKKGLFEKLGFYRPDLEIAGDFELLLRLMYVYKIRALYIRDLWVKMRVGGISTSGFKSIIKLNNEILFACKVNNIFTNRLMIYSKYLVKWWGFIQARTRNRSL